MTDCISLTVDREAFNSGIITPLHSSFFILPASERCGGSSVVWRSLPLYHPLLLNPLLTARTALPRANAKPFALLFARRAYDPVRARIDSVRRPCPSSPPHHSLHRRLPLRLWPHHSLHRLHRRSMLLLRPPLLSRFRRYPSLPLRAHMNDRGRQAGIAEGIPQWPIGIQGGAIPQQWPVTAQGIPTAPQWQMDPNAPQWQGPRPAAITPAEWQQQQRGPINPAMFGGGPMNVGPTNPAVFGGPMNEGPPSPFFDGPTTAQGPQTVDSWYPARNLRSASSFGMCMRALCACSINGWIR